MRYLAILAIATLAACAPAPETKADAGAAAKRMPLPDCGEPGAGDCRMQADGVAIEVRYAENAAGDLIATMQVVAPGDATIQSIEQNISATPGRPTLQDLEGDGRPELIVPVSTGNVNTTQAVWHQAEAGGNFVQAGELNGVVIGKAENGYIYASARSSAASWQIDYFRMNGSTLNAMASVTVSAEGQNPDGTVRGVTCEAADAGAMTSLGLTPEQLDTTFCGDPAAMSVFGP